MPGVADLKDSLGRPVEKKGANRKSISVKDDVEQ